MVSHFVDQWRSITSNRFVLNMVQDHCPQLSSHPPMFHNLQPFNVKAAAAHHPIIQKEVDELLAKGAKEASSGAANFYSSVFVVHKHTGDLWHILNLKLFNHYLNICYFKMPTIRHIQRFIQHGDYAFFIDLQKVYSIFLLLSIIIFNDLLGTVHHISRKFYLLGWPQPLGFSWPSLNLSCFFAITRVSVL